MNLRVKDVKMSASKLMYKSDFMSIESTLNVSVNVKFKQHIYSDLYILRYMKE